MFQEQQVAFLDSLKAHISANTYSNDANNLHGECECYSE